MKKDNPITMRSAWLYKEGEPLGEIKDVESIDIIDESDPTNQSKIDSLFIDDWNDGAQSFQINIEKDKKGYTKLIKRLIRDDRKAYKRELRKIRSGKKIKMSEREIRKELKIHKKWMKTYKGRPANFSGRELYNVDLSNLNLCYANFQGSILKLVNFNGADLKRACFVNAQFYMVELNDADLCTADMANAMFANVTMNENTAMTVPLQCPSSGSFIGWKKAIYEYAKPGRISPFDCIVKLLIPEDAKRSSAFNEKCRCNRAIVLDAYDPIDYKPLDKNGRIHSMHDPSFVYRIGDTLTVPDFDEDRWEDCSRGIHFFIDEESARNY